MLNEMLKTLENWNRLGAIMSKRSVGYFMTENARGEYAGWLKTKADLERQVAIQMLLESEDGTYPVEVKKVDKKIYY